MEEPATLHRASATVLQGGLWVLGL
jgi:hypothetical protein